MTVSQEVQRTRLAEKLRRAVEELPPLTGGMSQASTQVTISLGGTSLSAGVVDAELLISRADQALYQAKRTGRNRVVVADSQTIERGPAV